MKLRRLLYGLLTILLLSAQQAAFAHVIWHASQKAPAKEQYPHTNLCDKCITFEKVSTAVPSSGAALPPLQNFYSQPAYAEYCYLPRTVVGFHSRAPPVLL